MDPRIQKYQSSVGWRRNDGHHHIQFPSIDSKQNVSASKISLRCVYVHHHVWLTISSLFLHDKANWLIENPTTSVVATYRSSDVVKRKKSQLLLGKFLPTFSSLLHKHQSLTDPNLHKQNFHSLPLEHQLGQIQILSFLERKRENLGWKSLVIKAILVYLHNFLPRQNAPLQSLSYANPSMVSDHPGRDVVGPGWRRHATRLHGSGHAHNFHQTKSISLEEQVRSWVGLVGFEAWCFFVVELVFLHRKNPNPNKKKLRNGEIKNKQNGYIHHFWSANHKSHKGWIIP